MTASCSLETLEGLPLRMAASPPPDDPQAEEFQRLQARPVIKIQSAAALVIAGTLRCIGNVSCWSRQKSRGLMKYRGGPLGCTGFRRVFRSRKWGRQNRTKAECRNRVQEKTKFGKKIREDTSRHPKPISHPQTRQDPVVGVFPMESSN